MKIYSLKEIKEKLNLEKAISMQEEGFKLLYEEKVSIPPVGYLDMGKKFGEVHVKSGWIKEDDIFVVKVAGAFSQNAETVQGSIFIFDAISGSLLAVLLDEGYLTNIRTAIAGLITARYLAPKKVSAIGILGTGVQARLQAEYLKYELNCNKLVVWGRNHENTLTYLQDMIKKGFDISIAKTPHEVAQSCNLIIATTSAQEPLLWKKDIKPNTHITAVGADAPNKQELDPTIFKLADIIVVDSKSQCLNHGESQHAFKKKFIDSKKVRVLGEIISTPSLGRTNEQAITVADLTGVSIQDIQIAKTILS